MLVTFLFHTDVLCVGDSTITVEVANGSCRQTTYAVEDGIGHLRGWLTWRMYDGELGPALTRILWDLVGEPTAWLEVSSVKASTVSKFLRYKGDGKPLWR